MGLDDRTGHQVREERFEEHGVLQMLEERAGHQFRQWRILARHAGLAGAEDLDDQADALEGEEGDADGQGNGHQELAERAMVTTEESSGEQRAVFEKQQHAQIKRHACDRPEPPERWSARGYQVACDHVDGDGEQQQNEQNRCMPGIETTARKREHQHLPLA